MLPDPFSKRDYIRFGIETLKKNFLVKAVDCTAWLHPELWQEYSKIVFKSEDHVVISCKKDFLTLLNEINPDIIIDELHADKKTNLLVNLHSHQMSGLRGIYIFIFFLLKKC